MARTGVGWVYETEGHELVRNLEGAVDGKTGAGNPRFAALWRGLRRFRARRRPTYAGALAAMPLKLIHGPPNSGRAGLDPARLRGRARARPGPGRADRRRRLRLRARALRGGRGAGRLGDDLRGAVPHRRHRGRGAAGRRALRRPSGCGRSRSRSTRGLRAARAAAALRRAGPASPAPSSGCSTSCRRPGSSPEAVEASAATLEGSAYLSDIATLFAGYAEVRERTGRVDSHGIAREAIALLRRDGSFWGDRPVFLYGLDDLTPNQFELVAALAALTEVTVALPFEEGNAALAARARLLGELRERIGAAEETRPRPTRRTPRARCSSTSPAASARPAPRRWPSPTAAWSCCARPASRGEAEAIAAEVSRLVARRRRPGRDRDRPARPGAARAGDRRGAGGQRDRDRAGGGAAGRRDRGRRRPGGAAGGRVRRRGGPATCCATCAGRRASPRAGSTGWSGRCGAAGSRTRRRR